MKTTETKALKARIAALEKQNEKLIRAEHQARKELGRYLAGPRIDQTLEVALIKGKPTTVGIYIGNYFFGGYPQFGLFRIDSPEGAPLVKRSVSLQAFGVRIALNDFKCIAHRRIEITTEGAA